MIRLLENEETRDIKLYDVVNYAGHDWYVIGLDGNIATLLVRGSDFWAEIFDRHSNDYKTSRIRQYLRDEILPDLIRNGANPIPTRLSRCKTEDKLFLLSIEEAEALPKNIRRFFENWWLRSSGNEGDYAAYVDIYSGIHSPAITDNYGRITNDYAVRPAMRVRLEDLQDNSL